MRARALCAAVAAAILATPAAGAWAEPAAQRQAPGLSQAATPESVGFDSQRLERLHDYLAGAVAQRRASGFVTLLARHGQVVEFKTYGQADLATGRPMTEDTIFVIASMTKPVTGVALMMLFEEGRWRLNDPVTKFIPELKSLKVLAGTGPDGKPILKDMKRPPTMRELMSHTGGFGYYLDPQHPVDKLYYAADVMGSESSQQLVDRVAGLPLVFQPGEAWYYSIAVDLQGIIVERLSGMSLGQFMQARIFQPLGMKDTSFHLDPAKAGRRAAMYVGDPKTGRLSEPKATRGVPAKSSPLSPTFDSGGVGLVSTVGDYARFAQMLLNGGALGGARILSPASVELMGANAVAREVLISGAGNGGAGRFNPGEGFGLDFKVIEDPRRAGRLEGAGTMSWNGAASTWFWVDPTNDLIFVGMVQRLGGAGSDEFGETARVLTYQALTSPEK